MRTIVDLFLLQKVTIVVSGLVRGRLVSDVKESELEFAMGKGRKLRSLKDLG